MVKIKDLYDFARNELFSLNRSIIKDTLKTLLLIKKIPYLKIKNQVC